MISDHYRIFTAASPVCTLIVLYVYILKWFSTSLEICRTFLSDMPAKASGASCNFNCLGASCVGLQQFCRITVGMGWSSFSCQTNIYFFSTQIKFQVFYNKGTDSICRSRQPLIISSYKYPLIFIFISKNIFHNQNNQTPSDSYVNFLPWKIRNRTKWATTKQ